MKIKFRIDSEATFIGDDDLNLVRIRGVGSLLENGYARGGQRRCCGKDATDVQELGRAVEDQVR